MMRLRIEALNPASLGFRTQGWGLRVQGLVAVNECLLRRRHSVAILGFRAYVRQYTPTIGLTLPVDGGFLKVGA